MISKDIESAKMIVQGKGQVTHISVSGKMEEVRKAFDHGVIDNFSGIIKMEGSGEGIGIDDKGRKA